MQPTWRVESVSLGVELVHSPNVTYRHLTGGKRVRLEATVGGEMLEWTSLHRDGEAYVFNLWNRSGQRLQLAVTPRHGRVQSRLKINDDDDIFVETSTAEHGFALAKEIAQRGAPRLPMLKELGERLRSDAQLRHALSGDEYYGEIMPMLPDGPLEVCMAICLLCAIAWEACPWCAICFDRAAIS